MGIKYYFFIQFDQFFEIYSKEITHPRLQTRIGFSKLESYDIHSWNHMMNFDHSHHSGGALCLRS